VFFWRTFRCTSNARGTAIAQWLRCCATTRKVAGSIPVSVSEFFIDIKSFRSHYGPGVDSAFNINECREYFLGVKSSRCVRLTTLPPSCAVVTKSGSLNFLEPTGPVKACNGTALPFTFTSNASSSYNSMLSNHCNTCNVLPKLYTIRPLRIEKLLNVVAELSTSG